ncbi:hypothetical protein EON63_10515 [archaeon]|nr:MAG: hypothetical protein EON63_10515 [archaeon]
MPSSDCPSVDFEIFSEAVTLTLTISIGGVWKPEFVFTLLPVALDKIDILEAKLRDAQEEIEQLRAHKELVNEVVYFSLSSKTACGNQQIVQWDEAEGLRAPRVGFEISADSRQITVLKAGTYQIYVRLAGSNTANGQLLCLVLNNNNIASCLQSDTGNYQNTAQLLVIKCLPANSVLQVRSGFNGNSLALPLANSFTILRLGN